MDLLSKEVEAISFLYQQSENRKLAVSFSGGKDSLVVLDLCTRVGIEKVVFSDTTIEFKENLNFIKTVEKVYGIKIDVVSSNNDFFDVVDRVGFPSRRLRWCCDVFKFGPLAKYAIDKNLDGYVTGLRRAEAKTRADYFDVDNNQMVPISQINPILNWEEDDVWEYINEHNLPINPLYEYFDRIGCWCCPFQSMTEWDTLEKYFPELMEKLEAKLDQFADQIGIKDKEQFIKEKKWTGWATAQSKSPAGTRKLCDSGEKNTIDLGFFGNSEKEVKKISKLLPILTDDYFTIGKSLRITVDKNKKQRVNTLIEKCMNCVGCGACTALCPLGALYVENGLITVDENLCTKCEKCLSTKVLRGACIVRNYAPNRKTITSYH
ncbi:phosphoadenosine phosphosulfate reductase [Methanohalobium evestigatum Z-7303]|uniref:Phosphoadenosine phosphosulfate reductase n=1 Tax=Methanohalobium evestigatum (strain ATCC BAA-1072 / DSM 3721 / NBRC 107634 / OCM 161 / Z-7303) TaxID=644295 RepID=D7E660_METEZ|nr:phosphoadenosine phosphosulfate reductase family protein [Methanohalobium evestigatum]ADI73082.1 phosphoadenosine phosphosulfate reductase [Methanohalobium evestigatum Z-7303]